MNAENPVQIDLFGVSATRTKDTRLAEHIGGYLVSLPVLAGPDQGACGVDMWLHGVRIVPLSPKKITEEGIDAGSAAETLCR